jgi:hypothetical protein
MLIENSRSVSQNILYTRISRNSQFHYPCAEELITFTVSIMKAKLKVKVTLEQDTKGQMGNRL